MISLDILSHTDESLSSAVRSGFKRIRSWRVPPNWSRGDWFEELAAVGTAAAWQAVCDFDPERGIPLAGFGYCRMMTRCLAHYRKEWRYALHLVASDSYEKDSTTFKHPGLAASSAAKVNGSPISSAKLRQRLSSFLLVAVGVRPCKDETPARGGEHPRFGFRIQQPNSVIVFALFYKPKKRIACPPLVTRSGGSILNLQKDSGTLDSDSFKDMYEKLWRNSPSRGRHPMHCPL